MTQNIEEQKSQHIRAQQKTYKWRKKLLMCIFRKFPYCPTEETESLGGGGLRGVKGGGGGLVLQKILSMGLVGKYTVLKYDDNHHSMIQSRRN